MMYRRWGGREGMGEQVKDIIELVVSRLGSLSDSKIPSLLFELERLSEGARNLFSSEAKERQHCLP